MKCYRRHFRQFQCRRQCRVIFHSREEDSASLLLQVSLHGFAIVFLNAFYRYTRSHGQPPVAAFSRYNGHAGAAGHTSQQPLMTAAATVTEFITARRFIVSSHAGISTIEYARFAFLAASQDTGFTLQISSRQPVWIADATAASHGQISPPGLNRFDFDIRARLRRSHAARLLPRRRAACRATQHAPRHGMPRGDAPGCCRLPVSRSADVAAMPPPPRRTRLLF